VSKCWLCWCITRNEAEYAVSYGSEDRLLRVCRYCEQDLTLFGLRLNQIVRLPSTAKHLVTVACGSGLSLFMEAKA